MSIASFEAGHLMELNASKLYCLGLPLNWLKEIHDLMSHTMDSL